MVIQIIIGVVALVILIIIVIYISKKKNSFPPWTQEQIVELEDQVIVESMAACKQDEAKSGLVAVCLTDYLKNKYAYSVVEACMANPDPDKCPQIKDIQNHLDACLTQQGCDPKLF